ncbi:MAG: hypothetical protein MZU91_14805 [Desulfosudis oleivorans]|nr:hypothetical protein [Desulfosudis oleivorans]
MDMRGRGSRFVAINDRAAANVKNGYRGDDDGSARVKEEQPSGGKGKGKGKGNMTEVVDSTHCYASSGLPDWLKLDLRASGPFQCTIFRGTVVFNRIERAKLRAAGFSAAKAPSRD